MRPDRIFVAPEVDLYAILSVPRDATPDEVWTAYVREAERWHPAHNHTAEARDHFEAINLAYEILRDSEMRGQYDRWMAYERVKARTQVQSQAAPAPTAELAAPPASARRRRFTVVAVAALAAVLLAGGSALALAERGWVPARRTTPAPAPTAGQAGAAAVAPAPSASASPAPAVVRRPDPRQVTISAVDLGTGYEQVAANPVATQPGSGDLLASWDVVSQRAVPGSSTYRLVESILVVYPSVAGAAQELDNQRRTETARGAVVRTGVQLVGDDSEVWVEQVPARPSLRLVRISWRKENLVSQVSVLGPIATTPDGEAIALAQAQEVRLER